MADLRPSLDREVREYLEEVVAEALAEDAFAVVLIGSVARGAEPGLWSDVDVMVVDLETSSPPDTVHLLELKVSEVEDRIRSGDDVVQWAARYGEPLHGGEKWTSLVDALLPAAPWPDYRVKLRQAERRLDVSRALLDAGDARSAQKELVYASSHVARAVLFAKRVFPLSRPELPAQLSEAGDPALAGAVGRLTAALITSVDELEEIWDLVDRRCRDAAAPEASPSPV